MHKSKNYDMATQVAMDKLMPKPIQITISMQGGGGLTGLGERPISSVYGRPIPRTIYRVSGGDIGEAGDFIGGYTDYEAGVRHDDLQDDPTLAPLPTRPTPRNPEDLAMSTPQNPEDLSTSPEGSSIRQGTEGWTQRGFLNAFGVPFHPDRPTPRQEYAPRNFQTPRQEYGGVFPQLSGPTSGMMGIPPPKPVPTYYSDAPPIQEQRPPPEERAIGRVQEYVNQVRESGGKSPVDFNTAALITENPSAAHQFLDAVHTEGFYGLEAKGIEVPEELITAQRGPRRKRKGGGGLSSVKKSMNINGQPHKLAWINPGEASALKAMGGSGKKVEGIPAYDTNEDMWSDYDAGVDVSQGGAGAYGWDTGETDSYAAEQRDIETETAAAQKQYGDAYSTQESVGRPPQSSGGRGADPRTLPDSKSPDEYDLGKGLFGFGDDYDFNDVKKVWMTQYIQAHPGGRRDTRTQEAIDIEDDWQKAKNAPGGLAALAAGFKVGDPYGNQMRESFNAINKQLKKKFKSETDKKSVGQEDEEPAEMTREELSALVKDIDGLEDFTPYSGLDYPAWMPGGMAGKAIDFLSRTVIGTGTVGGVGVHIHKDGSVTTVSPEDSPGYDHESMKGENVEPIRRRRRGPPPVAQPSTLEPEAPAKGTMAELLARRGPAATRAQGLASLREDVLSQAYSPEQIEDFNLA